MTKRDMILVTGGIGFIGSNLLARLEDCGYDNIVCVDSFGCGEKWKNVRGRQNVSFVKTKEVFDFLEHYKKDIKAIIHLGAVSSTTESDVDKLMTVNIQLSIAIYEFAIRNSVQFVYASSASVYGDGNKGFKDNEDSEYIAGLTPLNPYSWSKLSVDRYILKSLQSDRVVSQVVGLRFFNAYGPNEYHKEGQYSVVYKFYLDLLRDGVIKLFKSEKSGCPDGEQKRDFVYVGDCVDVIVWMLQHSDVRGIYNVGSGQARSFNDVGNLVIANAGLKDGKLQYIDMPKKLSMHYQYYTEANIEKLRGVGYSKKMTTLEEGIKQYVNEYLKTNNSLNYEPNYI